MGVRRPSPWVCLWRADASCEGARMTSEARNGTGTAHVHHWMLSEPSGGEVPGRCKGCGEERGFPANPSNPYLRGLAKKRPTGRQS